MIFLFLFLFRGWRIDLVLDCARTGSCVAEIRIPLAHRVRGYVDGLAMWSSKKDS